MHETYRMIAQNRIHDRMREAADWRLAAAAQPSRRATRPVARILAASLARLRRQAAARARGVDRYDSACA
jgi:hypothetical protein